jgi:hypothetical protein
MSGGDLELGSFILNFSKFQMIFMLWWWFERCILLWGGDNDMLVKDWSLPRRTVCNPDSYKIIFSNFESICLMTSMQSICLMTSMQVFAWCKYLPDDKYAKYMPDDKYASICLMQVFAWWQTARIFYVFETSHLEYNPYIEQFVLGPWYLISSSITIVEHYTLSSHCLLHRAGLVELLNLSNTCSELGDPI